MTSLTNHITLGIYFDPLETGTGFLEGSTILTPESFPKLNQALETLVKGYKHVKNIHLCPNDYRNTLNPTVVTSIAAKYLYHLNSNTKSALQTLAVRYNLTHLKAEEYLSLQLRMNDKKYEMSAETWNWISDTSNIVREITPFFRETNIFKLFLGQQIYFILLFLLLLYNNYCSY